MRDNYIVKKDFLIKDRLKHYTFIVRNISVFKQ